ncbi:DUF262 domain-containing protein [Erwinia tasmaniensis]|uniref:DUF262 domain-containing protein n=1 Tax=Erwinia tasmaniensis (strain DSM 17950 / CFBP 7177 / CIP 109463 / NCPPB 4357 / Et1/99) TaxID=465817 RepID=B2VFK2_ERWT9|nr:DUF262 domain-containing protein [Erwinia tasmaniensis]CAO96415.1 Hypothetical protein ETA_13690 [Erwinia tasmaniensis Et1/99]
MNVKSLSELFQGRLLRIPDYQRGYAWLEQQFEDFWEDLVHLNPNRVHYTGVITLEKVKKNYWSLWENDTWIINGIGYKPYYVVDGQQRLTTAIIMIQAILESVPDDTKLNFQSKENIRNKFILFKADDGQRQSFIFGYEKDNPSDEYLKTKVFDENSHTNEFKETLYTRNLGKAKSYFKRRLSALSTEEIAVIYHNLSQKLKFNIYEIDDEIDVFVTFETMNNRGKPLTSLELLKNRLIYLSTLFHEHTGHEVLRKKINYSWKTIYEYLGKNPEYRLDDSTFLRNHWTMYFKYSRQKGDDYIVFLLNEKFTAQNVTHPKSEELRLTVKEIESYITSLQEAIRPWFYMHNPYFQKSDYDNSESRILLDRLGRLSFRAFKPLVLASFVSKKSFNEINDLLITIERCNFTLFTLSRRRSNTGDTEFYLMARELLNQQTTIPTLIERINRWKEYYYEPDRFYNYISEKYKLSNSGFYGWSGLRYFLYEYDQWLTHRGKQASHKLSWSSLISENKDKITIEHIYPQTASKEYWYTRFGHLKDEDSVRLANSLGNLVPLSRSKNSSLQNAGFNLKKNDGKGVGYYNGSASENEIAQYEEWLPNSIIQRGLDLLSFMEERWKISIGDEEFKRKLLHAPVCLGGATK